MSDEELNKRLDTLGRQLDLEEKLVALEERLAASSGRDRPWWRSPKAVTTLGAIIAAVIPLNTAIQGWWSSYRDLQTKQLNQSHEVRRAYIDRVLEPQLGAENRKLIFEILAEFDDEPALQSWATKNLTKEEDRLQALQQERDRLKKEADEARKQLAEARAQLVTKTSEPETQGEELVALKAQIEDTTATIDEARAAQKQVSARIDGRPTTNTGDTMPAITYRLYIHAANKALTAADTIQTRLAEATGGQAITAAPVDEGVGPKKTTLNYFFANDQPRAYALVGCLNRIGLTQMEVIQKPSQGSALREGHFELWLGQDTRGLATWDERACNLP